MKRLKNYILLGLFVLVANFISAQDIHFSQFYLSPLNLNPAMTGIMNCNIRVVANYRNQWASVLKNNAYSTYSVSYDQRVPVGRHDYFGIGGVFWGDKAGEAEFGTTTGKLAFTYSKKMGGGRRSGHYLVVGAEGGIAQRSLNFLALKWGNQHNINDPGHFDPTASSGEDGFRPNFLFGEFGAGLLWFSVFDKNNNLYVGGAFHHLTRANQSFYVDGVEDLYSKFTFHAGGEFMLSDRMGLVPGIITMFQGPSFELNTGTNFKFMLGKNKRSRQAFLIGAFARISNRVESGVLNDAIILSTRFDYQNFNVGFSYDVNVSELHKASNYNGSFEFSLIYNICGPEKRNLYCPNF